MYNYLIKRAGSGFTTNCICIDKVLNAYVIVNDEKTYEPGTIFNFNYTGTVQEIVLFPGKYKLQCWGAQGGNSGKYTGYGSTGGYSEGILTLADTTTLYVFVGGKGESGSTNNLHRSGGWNGGGGTYGYTHNNSGDTLGLSFPGCGGGATDIATVTSTMTYNSYRTNRSSASLLSRCIVAGGGAGGSSRETSVTVTNTSVIETIIISGSTTVLGSNGGWYLTKDIPGEIGYTYTLKNIQNTDSASLELFDAYGDWYGSYEELVTVDSSDMVVQVNLVTASLNIEVYGECVVSLTVSSTDSSKASSNSLQQGGGTSGRGTSPGTQTGGGGSFGLGKNQTITNYRYASGAGGGGWYGGGSSYSDSNTSFINNSGGGSGFVNIAANSASRPNGYTGLQLDSGSTKAGNVSFPSPNGGNETGHSGNGYARITVLNPDGSDSGGGSSGTTASIIWLTKSGTWNESSNSSAADSKQFTCESPGSSGSTVLRCTFSGISSIKFKCRYQGESNYDYLTVGSIDTACTRSSYGTSLKGTSGTWKEITYTCDSGEHYVEFCYSKDGSVDNAPDNAEVYILEYIQ